MLKLIITKLLKKRYSLFNEYYCDVTKKWLRDASKNHKVIINKHFIDDKGIRHPINNLEKASIPSKDSNEYLVALTLAKKFGGVIRLQPRIETAKGYSGKVSVPTPDYIWKNEKWDLKTPTDKGKFKNIVERFFKNPKKVKRQANRFIIDFKNMHHITNRKIVNIAKKTLASPHRDFIKCLILIRNGKIIKVFIKNPRQARAQRGSM